MEPHIAQVGAKRRLQTPPQVFGKSEPRLFAPGWRRDAQRPEAVTGGRRRTVDRFLQPSDRIFGWRAARGWLGEARRRGLIGHRRERDVLVLGLAPSIGMHMVHRHASDASGRPSGPEFSQQMTITREPGARGLRSSTWRPCLVVCRE